MDLDGLLSSEQGTGWCQGWRKTEISDEMVLQKWGKDALELFSVAKTIEEDLQALDTLRMEHQARDDERRISSVENARVEEASSSSEGTGMMSAEEKRARKTREGAVATRVGV